MEACGFLGDKIKRNISSDEDMALRSRSFSSASNNSAANFRKLISKNKKSFNLASLDGFAFLENEEDKSSSEEKSAKDEICGESFHARVHGHLRPEFKEEAQCYDISSLFEDPPVHPHQFEQPLARMTKWHRKDTSEGNFYWIRLTRLARRFFEPERRPVQHELEVRHIEIQTEGVAIIESDDDNFESCSLKEEIKNNSLNCQKEIKSKLEMLKNLKDYEIWNAFKLALINVDNDNDSYECGDFCEKIKNNFKSLLKSRVESSNTELDVKFCELNLQSEMNSENSIIGDFGDIIPVNIDVEQSDVRRHQEWSIGEQKKLSGMLKGRQLNQIEHCEITTIASKLKRSNNSVIAKAKELLSKSNSFPAKRKVTENQLSTYNESESFVTLSRADKDMHASTHSEFEICTDLPDSHKFEYPNLPRKRVIEMILKGMPGCYGTKLQIFEAIQEKYNIPLSSKKTPQYKGFQQCLSKHFKFRKGFYRIRVNDSEYPALCEKLKSFEDCQSWKEKTFFILNQFPEKKARIDQIVQSFRTTLNTNSGDSHRAKSSVAVWEKNILKIFSKYDSLFDTTLAKSVYFLQ